MDADLILASPLKLNESLAIKNRFFKSAMSEQLGDRHHDPTPQLAQLYRLWSEGGVGISVTGNVMVDRTALGEPGNVVLDKHSDLARFRQWAEQGSGHDTQLWMQLNHPGKQIPAMLCKEPLAPSAIPLGRGLESNFNTPKAMTEAQILATIDAFAYAAKQAKACGFDGVQIHAAHGYLISQFLSPRHNQRSDQWGGSSEARQRFVLEVFGAIRQAVGPTFPVGIKLNSADFMKDGFSQAESMAVVEALAEAGVDLIEISGGTYESPSMVGAGVKASTLKREAYFLEYAELLRQRIDTPLVVTGGFRSTKAMEQAVADKVTDMVGVARSMALIPDLPTRALADPAFVADVTRRTTGFKALDRAAMLDITWYEAQLRRMAQGKSPKPRLSAWGVLVEIFIALGTHAFIKRRA
ncbi:NADH:flavin oxidoreductase/NADH oxidase family protein [Ferrimonas pelagia]|uniref:NADH:flavin oxidoreductase/NADH oxidase family protein n=1 Tax=Ferrimonas pelagia TaxID=1177826 RepID=A0ABP9EFD3_9GAMM